MGRSHTCKIVKSLTLWVGDQFSHRSKSSRPTSEARSEVPRAFGFEGQWGLIAWGKPETLLLEVTHKVSCTSGPRGKSRDVIRDCILPSSIVESPVEIAVAHFGDKDTSGSSSGGYSLV